MSLRKPKAFPTKLYIRFITYVVFSLFSFIFRIKKKLPKNVKELKSPYLLISNHVGFFDPFVIGNMLPRFTHFVSSDAAFRNPVQRFFLTRLGTIPKKKNMRDTKVIRDIAAVINQGESVGIFPEAVRNWAGSSFYIDPSIVKLMKLLKVPVVLSIMKGMNLMNPRWSTKIRYTRLEVEYHLLFTREQLEQLSTGALITELRAKLVHDEVENQRKSMNKIYSRHKAEHISHALYVCPACNAIDSFRARKNNFTCKKCDYDIHINTYGFFERSGKLYFDNIRDWYNWQEKYLMSYTKKQIDNASKQPILVDENSIVYHSASGYQLEELGRADVKLFYNEIVIEFKNRATIRMNFDDLQTINPQVGEKLEIYYQHEAYRIIGDRNGVSALKWEVAVNAIWMELGMLHKLSPYISQVDPKA